MRTHDIYSNFARGHKDPFIHSCLKIWRKENLHASISIALTYIIVTGTVAHEVIPALKRYIGRISKLTRNMNSVPSLDLFHKIGRYTTSIYLACDGQQCNILTRTVATITCRILLLIAKPAYKLSKSYPSRTFPLHALKKDLTEDLAARRIQRFWRRLPPIKRCSDAELKEMTAQGSTSIGVGGNTVVQKHSQFGLVKKLVDSPNPDSRVRLEREARRFAVTSGFTRVIIPHSRTVGKNIFADQFPGNGYPFANIETYHESPSAFDQAVKELTQLCCYYTLTDLFCKVNRNPWQSWTYFYEIPRYDNAMLWIDTNGEGYIGLVDIESAKKREEGDPIAIHEIAGLFPHHLEAILKQVEASGHSLSESEIQKAREYAQKGTTFIEKTYSEHVTLIENKNSRAVGPILKNHHKIDIHSLNLNNKEKEQAIEKVKEAINNYKNKNIPFDGITPEKEELPTLAPFFEGLDLKEVVTNTCKALKEYVEHTMMGRLRSKYVKHQTEIRTIQVSGSEFSKVASHLCQDKWINNEDFFLRVAYEILLAWQQSGLVIVKEPSPTLKKHGYLFCTAFSFKF